MSTQPPNSNVTIESHQDQLAAILAAIFQTISVLGPIVIQWIQLAEAGPAKITVNK